MTDKKYKYWLAVVDGQLVQFSDLAHMMATALHPEGGTDYVAARINLDDELKLAVRSDLLRVRNRAGLGFHTFPYGDALQRAVLIPNTDLEPFLNERGIELRITPHGIGPDYWTLEIAAAAIQEQEGWQDGTRVEFQDQMQDAAQSGALAILDPRTCLPPLHTGSVRTHWEYVTPDSVNTWLTALNAPYLWSPTPPLVALPDKSPRDFKPWETLVPFYKPINGLYMYQQAAREIADAEGWDDTKLEAIEAEMISAINSSSLPIRSRKTGMVIAPDSLDALALVTVDDVNEWLERNRVPYRWKLLCSSVNHAVDFVQSNQSEDSNAWYNATLDAGHWWGLGSVTPKEAAMLLCRFNPHDGNSSPLTTTTDLTTPDDFKKLLREFEDSALTNPLTRNLAAWLEVAESRKLKFHKWIEPYASMMTIKVGDVKSAQLDKTKLSTSDDAIDFNMIATRQQLIDAFGVFTGMDDSWFTHLKDTPRLKDARKVAGSGGKDSTEPLFCPYEVMMWLADPKQKKGRKLGTDKGWQLLEHHFQKVYNQYSIGDTRNH